jgi:hypothetical protein
MKQKKPSSTPAATVAGGKAKAVAKGNAAAVKAAAKTGTAKRNASSQTKKAPQLTYGDLVKQLAATYGVKVGEVPPVKANPYRRDAAETEKILRKAGIHTETGDLAPLFK